MGVSYMHTEFFLERRTQNWKPIFTLEENIKKDIKGIEYEDVGNYLSNSG